jgi:F-type H+-transporting ATPase subunit epsilon
MDTFLLKIVASDKVFYEGEAVSIVLPSIDGEKEVRAHHEPYIIAVDSGEVRFRTPDMKKHIGVCGRGFAKVSIKNEVELIVDTLERPEDIDVRRAEEAKERAMEQLRQKQSYMQYHQSKAALARAMSRLKEARKYMK